MFIKLTDIRNKNLLLVNTDDIVSVTTLPNGGRITLRSREVLDFTETVDHVARLLAAEAVEPERKPAPAEKATK